MGLNLISFVFCLPKSISPQRLSKFFFSAFSANSAVNNYVLDLFRETLMLQNFIWNSLDRLRVNSSGNSY